MTTPLSRLSLASAALLACATFAAAGEPAQVRVRAMNVAVPKGFCQRVGLADDLGAKGYSCFTVTLTPREAKLFAALIDAEPTKDILTRPELVLLDDQAGQVVVGQEVPVIAGVNGVVACKAETRTVGVQLTVTPKLTADGKRVQLRAAARYSRLCQSAPTKGSDTAQAVCTQEVEATLGLDVGGTGVICCTDGDGKHESLWILKADVIAPAK